MAALYTSTFLPSFLPSFLTSQLPQHALGGEAGAQGMKEGAPLAVLPPRPSPVHLVHEKHRQAKLLQANTHHM